MNGREFFDLVAEMRLFQTLYRHSGSARARAKALERERRVDREVTRVTGILRRRAEGGGG